MKNKLFGQNVVENAKIPEVKMLVVWNRVSEELRIRPKNVEKSQILVQLSDSECCNTFVILPKSKHLSQKF